MNNPNLVNAPFFGVAMNIARQLTRDALWWNDDHCNWQGASLETLNGQYKVVNRTFRYGVYDGVSGIALFLAEVYKRSKDPILLNTLKGAVNTIIYQAKHDPLPNNYGYFSGKLGVGHTLWKLGTELSIDAWKQKGSEMVASLAEDKPSKFEIDVVAGAAGAIAPLLKMYAVEKEEAYLKLARKCGDFLLDIAQKDEKAWSWITIEGSPGLTGLSHGASGMALGLLELFAVTGNQQYQEAAMKGFTYEQLQFQPQVNNWPDLRNTGNAGQGHNCGEMWCHGAPGIALARIRAYTLTGIPAFYQEAQVALSTTYQSVARSLQNPAHANFSLCHGLAGNADILISGSAFLQDSNLMQMARQVGFMGMEWYDKTATNWPSGVNDPSGMTTGMAPTPGLMLGSAGTGYFYLRLAFPQEIDSVLMPH